MKVGVSFARKVKVADYETAEVYVYEEVDEAIEGNSLVRKMLYSRLKKFVDEAVAELREESR